MARIPDLRINKTRNSPVDLHEYGKEFSVTTRDKEGDLAMIYLSLFDAIQMRKWLDGFIKLNKTTESEGK